MGNFESVQDRQSQSTSQSQRGSKGQGESEYHNRAVEWGRQYDTAIHAELLSTGEPIRLIQPANVEGMSPTFLCARNTEDSNVSNVDFVSLDKVRITDPNFLPTRRAAR